VPSDLRNIVAKELKEIIRDPRLLIGMIVVPVLILPLMGFGIRIAFEASEEELSKMEIGVVNLDLADGNHTYSDRLYSVFTLRKISLRNSTEVQVQLAVDWARENELKTLIVIPANFSETILNGNSSELQIYQILQSFGFDEAAGIEAVSASIAVFNRIIIEERLASVSPGSSVDDFMTPAQVKEGSVVRGTIVDVPPAIVLNTIMSTSYMIPIVIAMVIILAAQLAATSVAMEKEQKTMEVLLTLPIRRTTILVGKLSGVILVAALATFAMILSFTYYMSSFQIGGAQRINLEEAGIAPDLLGYTLLTASLFLSIISALALAVLLAAYTKDVRSAQSLLGILFLPIFMPAFLLMFAPIEILPIGLQGVIYAIPFSYSSLAAKALYTKEYLVIVLGIAYQIIFTAVVLGIAAKFFASEKILTAQLKLRRGKKKKASSEIE